MSDILNTAVSGLLTFQRSLGTVSHNIANVNTEGFSRQRVDISTNTPSYLGDKYYGNGANVNSVGRVYDQFLTTELRNTSSEYSKLSTLSDLSAHVDDVLGDPIGGISPSIHNFFSSFQDLADDPTSIAARHNVISEAETLTSRFHNIDGRFQQLQENTAKDIKTVVNEINTLVNNIKDVNEQLSQMSQTVSNQQSSDLLDQRDRLVQQLAENIDISVINEGNTAEFSIFIGSGQTILNGTEAFSIGVMPDTNNPSLDNIVYNGFTQVTDISHALKSGGKLAGLLEFRDNVLTVTRNELGRVAIAIADSINGQHHEGMDLNNNLGGDIFSIEDPQIIPFTNNPGSATITTSVTDLSALTRYDYTLEYDGANWTMTSSVGTVSGVGDISPTVPATIPPTQTLNFEGISIIIDDAASLAGDQYSIKPTIQGASSISLLMTDPLELAMAAPIRTHESQTNNGTASISPGQVTAASHPNLLNPVTLTFTTATTLTSATSVTIEGTTYAPGAPIPFSKGMVINANGWQATLNGIPQANDQLIIEPNFNGQGDNRNALEIGNLQITGILDNGQSNYQQAYSALVGRVGAQTAAAYNQRDAAETLNIQARDRRDSKSGVNLDEEAADLVRFQQAYEAASRVISTVQTLFDSLMAATR